MADVMDIMALGNSTINFVVYYFMSKQFRKTFIDTCGFARCCPQMCNRSNRNNANNNDVSSYNGQNWQWLETISTYIPCLRCFQRHSYGLNNDMVELPELKVDKGKVELVDDSHKSPNSSHGNARKKGHRNAAAAEIEDQICEATPLVQKDKPGKNQAIVLETQPTVTMTTYIPNDTKTSSEIVDYNTDISDACQIQVPANLQSIPEAFSNEAHRQENGTNGTEDQHQAAQQQEEMVANNITNGETDSNGKTSDGEQKVNKTCATVLSIEGMPKSSVSSQTETAIINHQKSLRDTLSSASGTAV